MIRKTLFITCLTLIFLGAVSAQEIRLKGIVIDRDSKEPLAFCNIFIPQIKQGHSADVDGNFDILLDNKVDSIVFYYMGYKNEVIKWRQAKRNTDSLVVEMESAYKELQEIVIQAPKRRTRDTLATRIYRGVIENKDNNKPRAFATYAFNEYTKLVGSFYNFNPKLINRRIVKPFKFIFENYDSTADGRLFVPLLIKESITENHFQRDPEKERKQVIASRVSGVEQARFSEVLDYVFEEMDVYGNQLILSGRGFMLPFAEGAMLKYRYFFLDSTENELCEWVYHLAFAPIAKGDPAFKGEVWIHAPTYAIQKIELELDSRANINWYTDFLLHQDFFLVPGEGWILNRERRTTGLSITQRRKSKAVHLEQLRLMYDISINEPIADSIWKDKNLYARGHDRKKMDFWDSSRPESLSPSQKNVYYLMDTLKSTKAYKVYSQLGRLLSTGHLRAGPLEVGSIAQAVSVNPIEGWRFRAQVRANRTATPNWRYLAYVAYGLDDQRFKYGVEARYRIPNQNNLLNEVGFKWKDDYQRFSLSNQEFDYDHISNTLFRRRAFEDLVYVRDFSVFHRKQYTRAFRLETGLDYKNYKTLPGQTEFTTTMPDGNKAIVNNFQVFTPRAIIAYTPGGKFLQTDGAPVYLSGNLPRIFLDVSASFRNLFGSDFNYQRINLDISQRVAGPLGWTRYTFSASKLFGEIPYPLLYIHQGNQNLFFDSKRFSNMREGEYAADQQLTLMMEHHFDGFFLNRVPLVKKLQWREVFLCKMALSKLSPEKTSFLDLPPTLTGLDGFYAEVGFGVENVFKMLAAQFTWRVTQQDKPDITRFAVRISLNPVP